MESPIYTVPELTRIVRVVGDDLPIKVTVSFIVMSLFPKWRSLVYTDLLSCVRDFLLVHYKYWRRTLTLLISGDIQGAGGYLAF